MIELDVKAIKILERQAKFEKRSLKNYIEHTLEEKATMMSEPSDEYKKMMNEMIERHQQGTLETIPYEEIRKKYGF